MSTSASTFLRLGLPTLTGQAFLAPCPENSWETDNTNTERELAIPTSCPDLYRSLAVELSAQLSRAEEPPDIVLSSMGDFTSLIETTSHYPVALRLVLPHKSSAADGETSGSIALLLPRPANLVAWFRAFLIDIHETDPAGVPRLPPRLSQPSDWYTLQERVLYRFSVSEP